MELPRDEMHVVMPDTAPVHFADDSYPDEWDDVTDEDHADEFADDATDFDPSTFDDEPTIQLADGAEPTLQSLGEASITTAASLAGEANNVTETRREPVDSNAFAQGMRVKHPEYGLGKIVALSGEGDGRTATVNFVMSGEKKFILVHSDLQSA